MSLTIVELGVKDNLQQYRPVTNENFLAVKEEIDSLEAVIDVTTGAVSANSIAISKGSQSVSTELLVVDASARFNGSVNIIDTIKGSNVHLSNSPKLTLVGGNVNMTGQTSNLNLEGPANFSGPVVLKNFGNDVISGSNTGTYSAVTSNVGTLSVGNKHGIILDFSNYSSSANISNVNNVKEFKIDPPTHQGQLFIVTVKANSSSGKPHNILSNSIVSLGVSQKIQFTEDYGVATFLGSGNSWILTSLIKANIV